MSAGQEEQRRIREASRPPRRPTYYVPEVPETTWKDVYNQAVKKGLWIYDPSRRQWFSPQEFKEFFERYVSGFANMFENCKVMDPIEGLKAADAKIIAQQEKRAELLARILADYKIKK